MMLKAPFDLDTVQPKNQYRVSGRKGSRLITATSSQAAAEKYTGRMMLPTFSHRHAQGYETPDSTVSVAVSWVDDCL